MPGDLTPQPSAWDFDSSVRQAPQSRLILKHEAPVTVLTVGSAFSLDGLTLDLG